MKKLNLFACFSTLLISGLSLMFVACGDSKGSGSGDGSGKGSKQGGIVVNVDKNGEADGGHIFFTEGVNKFHIDGIEYKTNIRYYTDEGELLVTGWGFDNFDGNAKIIKELNYNGQKFVVKGIYTSAFKKCSSLNSVSIPESATNVYDYAFKGCRNLTDVYCYAKEPPSLMYNAFDNVPLSKVTLHVSASSVDAYKAAGGWSEFGNIVAL